MAETKKAKSKAKSKTTTKAKTKTKASKASSSKGKKVSSKPSEKGAKLLSSGNPQIAMGYGDEPVKAYIAAMPGWKRNVGERLEQLIEENIPRVSKAVKWNTPLFGREEEGWFVSFYCYTKYITITFFQGASLVPPPPDASKMERVRYFKIYEGDEWDEAKLSSWFVQASRLPGEKL